MNKTGLLKRILLSIAFSVMLVSAAPKSAYADTVGSAATEIETGDKTELADEVKAASDTSEADVTESIEEAANNEELSEESNKYGVVISTDGVRKLKYIIAANNGDSAVFSENDIKSCIVDAELNSVTILAKIEESIYIIGAEGVNGRDGILTVKNDAAEIEPESISINISNEEPYNISAYKYSHDGESSQYISGSVKLDEYKRLEFTSNKACSIEYNYVIPTEEEDVTKDLWQENHLVSVKDGKFVIEDAAPGYVFVIRKIEGTNGVGSLKDGAVVFDGNEVPAEAYNDEKQINLGKITKDVVSDSVINYFEEYSITINTDNISEFSYVIAKNLNQVDMRELCSVNLAGDGNEEKDKYKVIIDESGNKKLEIKNIPVGSSIVITDIVPEEKKYPYDYVYVETNNKTEQSQMAKLGYYTINCSGEPVKEPLYGYSLGKVDENSESKNYGVSCIFYSMRIVDNLTNGETTTKISSIVDKEGFDRVRVGNAYDHYTEDNANYFAAEVKAKASDYQVKEVKASIFYIDENKEKIYVEGCSALLEADTTEDQSRKDYYILSKEALLTMTERFANNSQQLIKYYVPQLEIRADVEYKNRTISFISKSPEGINSSAEPADAIVEFFECGEDGEDGEESDTDSIDAPQVVKDYTVEAKDYYFKANIADDAKEHFELESLSCSGDAVLEKVFDEDKKITYYKLSKVHSDVTITANVSVRSINEPLNVSIDNKVNARATFYSSDLQMITSSKWKVPVSSKLISFTVTERATHKPKVSLVNGDSTKELVPASSSMKSNDKIEYTYKIYAVDIKEGASINIDDEPDTKDVFIMYKPSQVIKPKVKDEQGITINGEISSDDVPAEYKLLKYSISNTSTITITTMPYTDCKLIGATYKKTPVKFNRTGSYSFKVNGDMKEDDFVINSSATRTLVVTNTIGDKVVKVTGRNKTWSVKKNDQNYCAYIKEGVSKADESGITDQCMELTKKTVGNVTYEYEVVAKAGTSDVTGLVISSKDNDTLHFSFGDPKVAGKTVNVTISETVTTKNANRETVKKNIVSAFKFVVSPYVTKATLSGEKNNTINHELFTKKNYRLGISPSIPLDYIKVTAQYYDNDNDKWETFSGFRQDDANPNGIDVNNKFVQFNKGVVSVDASMDNLNELFVNAKGVPKLRIKIYDTTVPGYEGTDSETGVISTKTILLNMKTLENYTPTTSVRCTSDIDITLNLAVPKAYEAYKDYLRYDIQAVSPAGDEQMKQNNGDNEVKLDASAFTLVVGEDEIEAGNGHAKKYDVYSRIVFYLLNETGELVKDGSNNPIELFSSKTKTLKNVSTKAPQYEKGLKATGKTTKFYAGQEKIHIATAVFSKNTTYYALNAALYNAEGNNLVSDKVVFEFEGYTDVYLKDSSDLPSGKYTLCLWPKDEKLQNEEKAAKVNIVVYEPIRTIKGSVLSTRMYKKPTANNTMKVNVCYGCNSPKTKRVTYSIEPAEGISDTNNNIKNKYVTVNSSGVITVDRRYVVDEEEDNNKFKVVIHAADFKDNDVSNSIEMTVTKQPVQVTNIALKEDVTENTVYVGETYSIDTNACSDAPDSCVFSVSSKSIAEIVPDGSEYKLTIKKKGKFTVTCTAKDGGGSKVIRTFTAIDGD